MANNGATADTKSAIRENLYKSERAYRLDRRVDAWAKIPEIGDGLKSMDEAVARNVACNLDNQAAFMTRLDETQMSQGFKGFTPENMLRLVRLAMPNVVRNKIFTEFAMETARDSIKYVRPVYSKTFNGNELVDKTEDWNRLYEDDEDDQYNDINSPNYRRPIYESLEDRISQELANIKQDGNGNFVFKYFGDADVAAKKEAYDAAVAGTDPDAIKTTKLAWEEAKASKKWGLFGEKFLDGYTEVYYGNDEKIVVAHEDKRTGKFFVAPEFAGLTVEFVPYNKATNQAPTVKVTGTVTDEAALKKAYPSISAFDLAEVKVFARYDSEDDFNGDYLGEVEIKMSDYEFRPRPTTIGVTWSQLSEIVLDTSFNVSAEEYLVTYASQAIRMHLDYQAVKYAYRIAKTNPANYKIEFDAAYNINQGANLEGYVHNAQTFPLAVATIADNMLNDINRGGVTRMVAGPSAGTYLQLVNSFSEKGAVQNEGIHQIGELSGIPVFKAPKAIIPNDEILCVWKNPQNEADIAIAFGTLVPFFSTGIIQRKNFYKEAGLATYGDWHTINRKYLALIKINNIKDIAY